MSGEKTGELAGRVARHFSAPEWFTTFELALYGAIETEDGKDRTLDALAISRVVSRSNELVGIEIKASRADWLAELNNPLKADGWIRLVDRFCVVAAKGVVVKGELPVGWGFLEESGSGLRTVVRGDLLSGWRENGGHDPIPRELWVRILRRTLDNEANGALLQAEYHRGHAEGAKSVRETERRDAQHLKYELERLQEAVAAFQKASGIDLMKARDWGGERLGRAARIVLEHSDVLRSIHRNVVNSKRGLAELEKMLTEAGFDPEKVL